MTMDPWQREYPTAIINYYFYALHLLKRLYYYKLVTGLHPPKQLY